MAITNPQTVYMLIPSNCEYFNLQGKKGLCGFDCAKAVEMGECLGLSKWVQYNHRSLYKRKARGSQKEM